MAAFDDVVINRYNKDRIEEEKIKVRYVYAPKERVLFDVVNKAQNVTLPVVSVNITGISRDESRVFNKLDGWRETDKEQIGTRTIGMPVPVNINISMSILTNYQTDMDQILSNFVPYNNPYIILCWAIPSGFHLNQTFEIRSEVLWSGSINTNYPIDMTGGDKPRIGSDTSFTIKGWLFPAAPVESTKPIYFINQNFNVTNFLSSGRFTNYDDFNYLSQTDYNSNKLGAIASTELVSISAVPEITNVFVTNNESSSIEIFEPYIIKNNSDLRRITLYGKGFNYTEYVLLSSNDNTFMSNLTSFNFTYYPTISGWILDVDQYDIITKNVMTINLPTLSSNSKFDIIVMDKIGWDSTISKNITFALSY